MLNFKVSPKDRPPEKKYPWDKFDVNKMSPKILFSSKDELHEIVADYGKNSKTCLKGTLKKDQKLGFQTDYGLMQVKSIAECSKGSILEYFRPSFNYHLP